MTAEKLLELAVAKYNELAPKHGYVAEAKLTEVVGPAKLLAIEVAEAVIAAFPNIEKLKKMALDTKITKKDLVRTILETQ